MSYYPDGHPAFDMPEFDPQDDEPEARRCACGASLEGECVVDDGCGDGNPRLGFFKVVPINDDAYEANDPKGPAYHSTHADIWDQREGK